MINKKRFLAILFPLLALAGCATNYGQESLFKNGYSDYRIAEDRFVVTFRANEHTPEEKAMEYALKRAAELTLKQGYRYFAVLDQTHTGKHLSYPSVRISIQCYMTPPTDREVVDAPSFISHH